MTKPIAKQKRKSTKRGARRRRNLISATWARTKPDADCDAPPSLVFFEHIAKNHGTARDYVDAVALEFQDSANLRRQIAEQIWSNAKVASGKFTHVNRALLLLLTAIAVAALAGTIISIWIEA